MLPYLLDNPANPSSQSHSLGLAAAKAVEAARAQVGLLIGSQASEVVFTSGATESNNLAILGAAASAPLHRRRILVSAVEHKCVLAAAETLKSSGFEVARVPVLSDGVVDLAALVEFLDDSTAIVCVQAASNEIGTVQPIDEVAQLVHRRGALLHCDAAQAGGRIPIDVEGWDVDLLSLSAHKMYGPKGVGALFVRGGARSAPIRPQLHGGGQENGLRSGTLNVPGIVGFGRAAELAIEALPGEQRRIAGLRDRLERLIVDAVPPVRRNGSIGRRLAGNTSLTFCGADAEAVIANVPGVAVSTGAACSSGALEPSHVLTAIGLPRRDAYSTIRLGLGRFTSDREVDDAAARICAGVARVRAAASVGALAQT
jgi:cysteine desulfurase